MLSTNEKQNVFLVAGASLRWYRAVLLKPQISTKLRAHYNSKAKRACEGKMKIAFPKSVLNLIVSFLQVLSFKLSILYKRRLCYIGVSVLGEKAQSRTNKHEQIKKHLRTVSFFLFVIIQKRYFVVAKRLQRSENIWSVFSHQNEGLRSLTDKDSQAILPHPQNTHQPNKRSIMVNVKKERMFQKTHDILCFVTTYRSTSSIHDRLSMPTEKKSPQEKAEEEK